MDSTTWIPEGFKEEEIDRFTDDDFLALSQKEIRYILDQWKSKGSHTMHSDNAVEARLQAILEKKLAYAPPGFTVITSLREAISDDELARLPQKARQKLMQRWEVEKPNFMKVLEEKRFEHGGFVIFQCGGYQDEERWNRYKAEFEKMLFNDVLARTNEPEMLQKIGFIWIEDEVFQKASAGDTADYYRDMIEDGAVPEGMTLPVFLVVSELAICSLLDGPGEGREVPFVVVVDKDIYDETPEGQEPAEITQREWDNSDVDKKLSPEDAYNGRFKAALSVLLDKIWAPFISGDLMPDDIAPVGDVIYQG